MVSFFDMVTFLIALIYSDPRQFSTLTTVSAIMVFIACVLYSMAHYFISHNKPHITQKVIEETQEPDEVELVAPPVKQSNLRVDKSGQPSGSVLGDSDPNPADAAEKDPPPLRCNSFDF